MWYGCVVIKVQSTFDSLVREVTAIAGKNCFVSRCGCNIFTIGNRYANRPFRVSTSSIRRSFSFSPSKPVHAVYDA